MKFKIGYTKSLLSFRILGPVYLKLVYKLAKYIDREDDKNSCIHFMKPQLYSFDIGKTIRIKYHFPTHDTKVSIEVLNTPGSIEIHWGYDSRYPDVDYWLHVKYYEGEVIPIKKILYDTFVKINEFLKVEEAKHLKKMLQRVVLKDIGNLLEEPLSDQDKLKHINKLLQQLI